MDERAGDSCACQDTEITVLAKGQTFLYVVPSFPVYKATLQEVKLQQDDGNGNVYMFDGFARKCDLLDHHLPAMAKIPFSYENAFIINVSYVCQQLPPRKPDCVILLQPCDYVR